jgi:hypothetical protein
MSAPQIPIDVDPATGVWTTDALPMIYVPRHYFVNLQTAMAEALGEEAYRKRMYEEGRKAAFEWCAAVSKASGMRGIDVFHHYMRRLSQRGWGLFHPEEVDLARGTARIRLRIPSWPCIWDVPASASALCTRAGGRVLSHGQRRISACPWS